MARNSPRITATQEGLATFAELITGSHRHRPHEAHQAAHHRHRHGAQGRRLHRGVPLLPRAGQTETDSFTSAARVFRGVPVTGGAAFTKDTVYLHGLLSVHTFFRWALKNKRLKLCRNLFAGKMTLHDVIALEP